MQYSNTHILLDIHAPDAQLCIPLHQGDTGHVLVIRLTDRGKAYPIGPDCTAVLAARKADGMSLLAACTILGDSIHYALSPQTTAAPGLVEAELRLYGDDNFLLTSPRFHLLVQASPVNDGEVSTEEQSALTSLISQTRSLNEAVEEKLAAGAFLPKFSIGSVQTLPSGSDASVSLSGSGEEPVLHFGIPQGPEGQAESLIPDTALSDSSLKPVQNKVIKAALDRKADKAETEAALAEKADGTETRTALSAKSDKAETEAALAGKVDKVSGKGLSTNDFTTALKSKLSGIEAGANRYVLPEGGVGTAHLANAAVTAEKIAAGAVSRLYTAVLGTVWSGTEAPYTQTLLVAGLPDSDRILADLMTTDRWEAEEEAYAAITKMEASAGSITVYAREKTETPLQLRLLVIHGSGLGSGGEAGDGSSGSGGTVSTEGLLLIDRSTGAAYTLCVRDGDLTLI